MAIERTFSIIKPDATRRNLTGKVNAMLEAGGLRIVAQKRLTLTRAQAEGFYAVHKERPFFNDLCTFMTSGPVLPRRKKERSVRRLQSLSKPTRLMDQILPRTLLSRSLTFSQLSKSSANKGRRKRP